MATLGNCWRYMSKLFTRALLQVWQVTCQGVRKFYQHHSRDFRSILLNRHFLLFCGSDTVEVQFSLIVLTARTGYSFHKWNAEWYRSVVINLIGTKIHVSAVHTSRSNHRHIYIIIAEMSALSLNRPFLELILITVSKQKDNIFPNVAAKSAQQ